MSEGTQSHYNQHAGREEAARHRQLSKTKILRRFHNNVKRRMIDRISRNVGAHVDVACGRGGDIRKWFDSEIQHVTGIDLARKQIEEAHERDAAVRREWQAQGRTPGTQCEFFQTSDLGVRPLRWPRTYDTASCMFSAHYLFETKETARNFFRNVSLALKDGGRFYGVLTSAQAVLTLLGDNDEYSSPILRVRRRWAGRYDSFGSPYTFAILHTVTNDDLIEDELGEGTPEYLTFFGVFTRVAAEFGLFPDTSFDWRCPPALPVDRQRDIFDHTAPGGKHHGFRYLKPRYFDRRNPQAAEDMATVSRLYAAFAFVKRSDRVAPEQRAQITAVPADASLLVDVRAAAPCSGEEGQAREQQEAAATSSAGEKQERPQPNQEAGQQGETRQGEEATASGKRHHGTREPGEERNTRPKVEE